MNDEEPQPKPRIGEGATCEVTVNYVLCGKVATEYMFGDAYCKEHADIYREIHRKFRS